jgi:predicted Zn-dependent protease
LFNEFRSSLITILLFGILLLMSSLFSPGLFYTAVASTDNDDNNNDYLDEDFEDGNIIQICCAWGIDLQDGKLTYHIDASSKEQQNAVTRAIEEWDSRIDSLDLERVTRITQPADIRIEFQDQNEETEDGEEIAGRTVTTFDQDGFLDNARITISKSVQDYEFDTATIEQIAKHEMGHALGLGHANFDGNLMAERVDEGTDTVSECEVKAVMEANYWKLGDDNRDNTYPNYPEDDNIVCEEGRTEK